MTYTSDNLNQLNDTFRRYYMAGKKSWSECIAKQAKQYAFDLARVTKEMAPPKGSIRDRLIAMLKAGRGLKIKPYFMPGLTGGRGTSQHELTAARFHGKLKNTKRNRERTEAVRALYNRVTASMAGKNVSELGRHRFSYQALLADNEINMRESKRMFTRASTMFRFSDPAKAESKIDRTALGRYQAKDSNSGTEGQFLWGSTIGFQSSRAAFILGETPKGKRMMDEALRRRKEDMEKYIANAHEKAARNASRNVRRALA